MALTKVISTKTGAIKEMEYDEWQRQRGKGGEFSISKEWSPEAEATIKKDLAQAASFKPETRYYSFKGQPTKMTWDSPVSNSTGTFNTAEEYFKHLETKRGYSRITEEQFNSGEKLPWTPDPAAAAAEFAQHQAAASTIPQSAQTQQSTTGSYVYGSDVLNKKANDAAVNTLYQSYFGRNAGVAELLNWGEKGGADTTVRALEEFLQGERQRALDAQPNRTDLPIIRSIAEIQSGVSPQTGSTSSNISGEQAPADTGSQTGSSSEVNDIMTELMNSPEWQTMSADMKALMELTVEGFAGKDEASRALAQKMLQEAKKTVDPYNAVLVSMAQQNIPEQFNLQKLSTEEQLKQNQETLQNIGKAMEDATFEEQQYLGSLSKTFEKNVENLETSLAEGGMTYSSKRAKEEKYIGEQNLDIIRSTERGTKRSLERLSQQEAAAKRAAEITKKSGELTLANMARSGEETLGSKRFGNLGLTGLGGSAVEPVGTDFAGSLEDQRQQQIASLAETYKRLENPEYLQNL